MANSLLLYGSRARGDAQRDSDVDLILATDEGNLEMPLEYNGVSLHHYPKNWLIQEARKGNLFVYHIAFEGAGLDDKDRFLAHLRAEFCLKTSYSENINTALLILKMLIEHNWVDNREARRRFFWAVRTIFICLSINYGDPIFSSIGLEAVSGIPGLAKLISERSSSSFADCRALGEQILEKFMPAKTNDICGSDLRALLIDLGGIARDSVRVAEEREAIEEGGLRLYL